jgi:alpha-aminoadipate/glutamate carrier protein LysW
MAAICPECDSPVFLEEDEVEQGETLQCEECGVDLEVVSTDPLELSAVDEAGYDDEDLSSLRTEEDE